MASPKISGVATARSRYRIRTATENGTTRKESNLHPTDGDTINTGDGDDFRLKYRLEDLDLKTTLGKYLVQVLSSVLGVLCPLSLARPLGLALIDRPRNARRTDLLRCSRKFVNHYPLTFPSLAVAMTSRVSC